MYTCMHKDAPVAQPSVAGQPMLDCIVNGRLLGEVQAGFASQLSLDSSPLQQWASPRDARAITLRAASMFHERI
eukprot:628666-Alexandrium_andersonii.AAC.1